MLSLRTQNIMFAEYYAEYYAAKYMYGACDEGDPPKETSPKVAKTSPRVAKTSPKSAKTSPKVATKKTLKVGEYIPVREHVAAVIMGSTFGWEKISNDLPKTFQARLMGLITGLRKPGLLIQFAHIPDIL